MTKDSQVVASVVARYWRQHANALGKVFISANVDIARLYSEITPRNIISLP